MKGILQHLFEQIHPMAAPEDLRTVAALEEKIQVMDDEICRLRQEVAALKGRNMLVGGPAA